MALTSLRGRGKRGGGGERGGNLRALETGKGATQWGMIRVNVLLPHLQRKLSGLFLIRLCRLFLKFSESSPDLSKLETV